MRFRLVLASGLTLLLPLALSLDAQNSSPVILVGSGEGGGLAREFRIADGVEVASGFPWGDAFTGGIRVAVGDINGDGIPDRIVGSGMGAGQIRVYSGVDAALLTSFSPFGDTFTGGVYVAAGDVDADGRADIIAGAGLGGGNVAVLSGANGHLLASGFPFTNLYTGGVTVAAGDFNGDGRADIIAGTAIGGAVRILNGVGAVDIAGGFPYGPLFLGGVNVAAGDVNGDGRVDVVTGPRTIGGLVRVFSGLDISVLADVTPFPSIGGVNVAAGDVNGDGRADLITGSGPGGPPRVRIFSGLNQQELASFLAFSPTFTGGVFVATVSNATGPLRFTSAPTGTLRAGQLGTFNVTTSGGPGTTIAMTGALPSGVTFTDTGNGNARLTGTPASGSGRTYPLIFTASRGGAALATQSFVLTIHEAPAFTSPNTAEWGVNRSNSFRVTTNGFPRAALTSNGGWPSDVQFNDQGDGTALIIGTPPATGVFASTITATNAQGETATQIFSLTVSEFPSGGGPPGPNPNPNPNPPPGPAGPDVIFISPASATFTVGVAGTFPITTSSDPAAHTIEFTGALPSGVTFTNNGNGSATLSGTPQAGSDGTYPLLLTGINSVGTAGLQKFTLTINKSPTPIITSPNAATFTVGAGGTFTVTTTAIPGVSSITSSGALPAGVTFTDNGNGTATLAGTPATGTEGAYPLTFNASNGSPTAGTQSFTLTVNAPSGGLPTITSANTTTFVVSSAGSFTVTTTGTPTATTIAQTGTLPGGVFFVSNGDGTATLSGTPVAGAAGTYPLVFSATNSNGTATQTFTLTVQNVTSTPAFTSATSTTFRIGAPGTFAITTAAEPPVTTITLTGTPPTGVTYTDHHDGTATLAGTPTAGPGPHVFTFSATNSVGAPVTQTFTLTVQQAAAITSAASTTFDAGAAGTFTVTTVGTPIPSLTRTGTLPAGVTFTDNGNGTATLTGTPPINSAADYTQTITATNGVGAAGVQTFTLTVLGNNPPTLDPITGPGTLGENAGLQTVTLQGVTAGPGEGTQSLIVTATSNNTAVIPHPAVQYTSPNATGSITFTPVPDVSGTVTITVTVTDNGDDLIAGNADDVSVSRSFSVQVTSINDPPTLDAIADPAALNEDAPQQTVNLAGITAGPNESQALTVTASSSNTALIPHPTVTYTSPNATGSLTYQALANQPTASPAGTAVITVTVRDAGEDGQAGNGDDQTTTRTFTVTVNPVNDVPTLDAIADPAAILEDAAQQTINLAGISAGGGETLQPLQVTATSNNTALIPNPTVTYTSPNATGTLTYTPVANAHGSAVITVTVVDGGLDANLATPADNLSVQQTFPITVNSVNDAPTFVKGADESVLEDSGAHTVPGWATMIAAGPANEAGQTTSFSVTNNTNPGLFTVAPAVAANGTLTYTLVGNTSGTATITVRLADDGGTANGGVDFSEQTFMIGMNSVNDAPSFTKGADQTVLEDAGAQTVNNWATAISAGPNEGTQTVSFEITNNSNTGLFSAGPAVLPTGALTYTPAPNANGTAQITLRITDNGGTANGGVNVSTTQIFNINVTAVNDAPSFTKGADVTVAEDSGGYSQPFATAISAGPNEGSQTVTFAVTANTNTALFATQPAVAPNGTLTFQSTANTFGTATITLRINDSGDTSNGGVNQSATQSFVITVNNVNDMPSFTKGADQTLLEDTAGVQTVGSWATSIDPGTNETDALTFNVSNDNNGLFSVQPTVAANGTLTYTLAANQNGVATVSVTLTDDAMTPAVPGDDLTTAPPQTFTITVNAVNDAPSFTSGGNVTRLEDSGAQTVAGWATAISKGAANESAQTLTFVVTNNTNPTLFAGGGAPAVDPTSGNLTFTAAGSAFGTATITLRLDDNGDTLNGGANQSAMVDVDIIITNVNDAPSFTKGANQTVAEDPGPQTVTGWATAISAGPNEGAQTVSFEITANNNTALFAAGPLVSPTGDLTYTPALNANGSATITLRITDNGGTADGGVNVSATEQFLITVNAVNDAPVAVDDGYTVAESGNLSPTALTGVLANDTDVEGSTLTATLVGAPPANAASFTLNLDGSFTYVHNGSETTSASFTYRANDGTDDSNLATVTITITPVNDAPVAADDASYSVNEGATLTVLAATGVLANDTDAELTTLTATLVTPPAHAAPSGFTLNPNGSFTYQHDGSETPLTDSFTYRAFDGAALSNIATVTITITAVNDTPVIDLDANNDGGQTGVPTTGANFAIAFSEGDGAKFIADTTDAVISDNDHTTLSTLTVTLTNLLDPTYEILDADVVTGLPVGVFAKNYDTTTTPGVGVLTITATPPQSIANFNTVLRRVMYGNTDMGPNPTDRTITVSANDGVGSSVPPLATTTVTVTTVNNAPTAVDDPGYSVNEGGTLNASAPGVLGNDTDADLDTLTAVLVSGPTHASSFTLFSDGHFDYVHDGNGFVTDTFTYRANDGLVDSPTFATVTITINSVNDAPSFTKGADITVLEESGAYNAAWATALNKGGAEESSQTLTFVVTNNTNPALFAGGGLPAVSGTTGNLTFTPAANAAGTATITLRLDDDGPGTPPNQNQSPTQQFVITVTGVNDAPAGTDNSVAAFEDTLYTFTAADFGFTDPNDTPANTLLSVVIATLPGNGSLTLSGSGFPATTEVTVADINAGNLKFLAAANANGSPYTTFTFQVRDNGGTANSGVDLDASANTLTVNVTAVNDAPAGTDTTVATPEDVQYTFTAANFGFTDPNDSPANTLQSVVITTLPGAGSLTLSGGAVTAGQEIALADITAGNLRFLAAANAVASPYTTFTFQVRDNGGTANGGVDLDPSANTLTINVTAVNDPPAGTNNTVATNEDASYEFTTADFGFTDPLDSPVNTFLSVRITTLPSLGSLTLSGGAVSAGQFIAVTDITAGNLDFTPASNGSGTPYTSFTFQVRDDGGTADGGVDLDQSANTLSINVLNINDAPSGTNNTVGAFEDTLYSFTTADFPFTDPNDSPANTLQSVVIATLPVAGSLTLSGSGFAPGTEVTVADITAGNLKFLAAANANGAAYASFTFQVRDNGGTANSGVDLDGSANTLTINVTSVNDAPAGTNNTVATPEDIQYIFAAADFGLTDPNDSPANTLQSVVITTLPGAGSLTLSGGAVSAGQEISLANITGNNLRFLGALNASGSPYTTFTFQVRDNGGIANGGVDLDPSANTLTVNVTPVNDAPVGGADSWETFGNTELRVDITSASTPNVVDTTTSTNGVLDNDSDPVEGDPVIVFGIVGCADATAPFVCATVGGGSVSMESTGEFTYTPQAGDTTSDSFQYILRDVPTVGTPVNVNITANLTLRETVWYVNGGVTGPGTGTSNDPFKTFTSIAAGDNSDSDQPSDYIFVHNSSVTGSIQLEADQHLLGEGVGLTVPRNMNGNGTPTLVAAGTQPTVSSATNTVAVTQAMPFEIRGLSLGSTAGNAIDLTATGSYSGSASLTIANNTFSGATAETIDVNGGATGTLALNITTNVWNGTHTNSGIDVRTTIAGGTINLDASTNTSIGVTGTGIVVDGSVAGTLNITGFSANTIAGTTVGTGVSVNTARFDSNVGTAGYQTVNAGTWTIGASGAGNGVGASGMVFTSVSGDISFSDLDIFADGGSALSIDGTNTSGNGVNTGAGTGTRFVVAGSPTLQSAGGPGVNISDTTITLPINSLTVTSSPTTGVSLVNVVDGTTNATFSVTSGAISGTTGNAFNVSGSNATVSYGGTITSTAARAVSLQGNGGDTFSFTNTITGSASTTGINLDNNDLFSGPATMSFSGGITLNGTNGTFTATNGGTLNVTGTNMIGNTSAPTGPALNVANTTIGASNLTFQRISATGGTNGIVLNTTGSTGGLTVAGSGGACTGVGNCTGGAIQNSTSHGISLASTQSPSFTRMAVQNTAGSGIEGTTVTNFTLQNSFIDNSGTGGGADDSNVAFNNQASGTETNISGTLTVTDNTLTNARWHGLMVQNFNGTLANAIVTGNTITSSTSLVSSLGYGINFQILGSATTVSNLTKANISGNFVTNFPSAGGIQVQGGNSNAAGTPGILGTSGVGNSISITGNMVQGQSAANQMATSAILVTLSGKGTGFVNVDNNGSLATPLAHTKGTTIGVGANGNTTLTATTNGNHVESNHTLGNAANGISGGSGVTFGVTDTANMTWTINNNRIRNTTANGILAVARGNNGTLNVTIKNNDVEAPQEGVRPGIRVDAGNGTAGELVNVCADIQQNTSAGSGISAGIGVRKESTSPFGFEGLSPSPATGPQMETFVEGLNPAGNGVDNISTSGGDGTNYTSCSAAPLALAPGGVEYSSSLAQIMLGSCSATEYDSDFSMNSPTTANAVTQSQVERTVEAAKARWTLSGLTAQQLLVLEELRFEVGDLRRDYLGEAKGNRIVVDRDAQGKGWFVDNTPADDLEFANRTSATRSYTTPFAAAAGRIDLLTAIEHEIGHKLGFDDSYAEKDRDSIMYGYLTVGERRVPAKQSADSDARHAATGREPVRVSRN